MRGFQLIQDVSETNQTHDEVTQDLEYDFDAPTLSGIMAVVEIEEPCEMCQHTEMCLLHTGQGRVSAV